MSEFDIILDSSQQNLKEIPSKILQMQHLKMLYLQQNFLQELPNNFFQKLPSLCWLDLRKNNLTNIPKSIVHHENLENLLLSGNKIEALPNELGTLPKLKVLQIAENPLVYPNSSVVAEGTKAIVAYLIHQYNKTVPQAVDHTRSKSIVEYEEEEDDKEEKESNAEKEIGVVADYLEYLPIQQSAASSLIVKGISKTKKSEIGVVHKISNPTSNKVLLKSFFDEDDKFTITSTQTTDSISVMPTYSQTWMDKLKQLLDQQEKILQTERNLQALTRWRAEKKAEPERRVEREVYQKAPPYATDPRYQTILSREDIQKEIEKMTQHSKKPPEKPNIEKLISDLVSQLKEMEATYGALESPRNDIESAGAQITKIMEMHKRIMQLQEANNLLLQ